MGIPTQQNILDALQRNETNLCEWSKAHEYKYVTVFHTVLRWAGRDDRTPHGGLARQIMSDLAVYVEATNGYTFEEQGVTERCNPDDTVTPSTLLK